jgi:hypothetical protein
MFRGRSSCFAWSDRADLIAFLDSLTDEEVIHDQKFANPWKTAK